MERLARRLGLDHSTCMAALRLGFAAWLAFAIAAVSHVDHAYWAAMPVWVVAQPSRGLIFERAFYRVVGTVLGAALGFAVLIWIKAPLSVLAVMGGWVAVCAAMTHLLRGVKSYGALLAGISAVVVILPAVLSPEHALDLALARIECTLIGVIVVTLVVGLFTPGGARQALYLRARQLAADTIDHAATVVERARQPRSRDAGLDIENATRCVMAEIGEVDRTARLASAGSLDGYRRVPHVEALVGACISLMAAAHAVTIRGAGGEEKVFALANALRTSSGNLRQGRDARALWHESVRPEGGRHAGPVRLAEAWRALVAADQGLFSTEGAPRGSASMAARVALAPGRNWSRALWVGLAAGVAAFASTALATALGGKVLELAAMGVCIFSMVLGSMPNPALIAPKLMTGVVAGVLMAILYRLLVQPEVTGMGMLLLTIAPFIFLGAFARSSRVTAMPALDANMCFMLASQAGALATSTQRVISESAALAIGAVAVGFAFLLIPGRSTSGDLVSDQIQRDLRRLSMSSVTPGADWAGRVGRRALQLSQDLDEAGRAAPSRLFVTLNLGHAISALHEMGREATFHDRERIAAAVEALRAMDDRPEDVLARLRVLVGEASSPRATAALWGAFEACEAAVVQDVGSEVLVPAS